MYQNGVVILTKTEIHDKLVTSEMPLSLSFGVDIHGYFSFDRSQIVLFTCSLIIKRLSKKI